MRSYTLTGQQQPQPRLALGEEQDVQPGKGDVVVDLRAASLNYRDLIMAQRFKDVVPLSDGAGVVSSIGEDVSGFTKGDRVVIGFMPTWIEGDITETRKASGLGAPGADGVLRERIVVPATGLVHIPETMSFEEAATLPCAGVTAWSALFERRPVLPGETVLLLGTGGVSIFALQLARLAGARVIITSSSDDKLARARELGADHVINYRRTPSWEDEVLKLTQGLGADLSIDPVGPATLNNTLAATRFGGRISLMGVITGFDGPINTHAILEKRITLQGIYVGPVSSLRALVATGIKPYIDNVFSFKQAEVAYDTLQCAGHFGKLVVQINR